MLKPIFLCADDFGLNTAINEGVIALGLQGRLSATSCMSLAPAFARDAATLTQTPLATGLHLSLTEPGASHMASQTLPKVILRSMLHQWSRATLHDEIRRQLDAFEDGMQRPPHHIDGHQHIHALPMIREVLLAELQRRYGDHAPTLRSTCDGGGATTWRDALKAQVIESLGSHTLLRQAAEHCIPTSHALLGVYGFNADADHYLAHLKQWMQVAQPSDIIMCHPAGRLSQGDLLGDQRVVEYQVLASSDLAQVMQLIGVKVVQIEPAVISAHRCLSR